MERSVYVGWDPREADAFKVAVHSIQRHLTQPIHIHSLQLDALTAQGLYRRPIRWVAAFARAAGVMWDTLSEAPMATEHANARFLVPHLAKAGWAAFMDGDILVKADLAELFTGLDPLKAVYCVQHDHAPTPGVKMDNQIQTRYRRKNWSSVMVFNCDHPANARLTLDLINTAPGRDLHRFCWLQDDEIGALDPAWNYLVGHSDPAIVPKIVHFTEGVPNMPGYSKVQYADEWFSELMRATL